MPRNWQERVKDLTRVQRLVHLAMRRTGDDVDAIRGELVKVRRRAYEQEIGIQAGRLGCSGVKGSLTRGPTLTQFNRDSKADAESIANTYNYSLAVEIERIGREVRTANRNTYAARLRTWDTERAEAKAVEVALWTESTARRQAQQDFARNNDLRGHARLEPRTAAEPVCQGWINRGRVPLREAMQNPPPYHNRCPHFWNITYTPKRRRGECEELWRG